jgi:HK97 family phage portal protein
MSILSRLIEPRSIENPETAISSSTILDVIGLNPTFSSRSVTPENSMQVSAVFACVSLLSETIASLPLLVYRRLENGRERASDHPVYPVLHDEPNPEQSSVDFRSTMMAFILLYGNSYAEIVRDGAGNVRQLWPLTPTRVQQQRDAAGKPYYQVTLPDQKTANLRPDRVLHVRNLLGLSPIKQAKEALGLSMAAEEYGARFFANDSRPGGILEHPGNLSDAAQSRLKKSYEAANRGLENRHRVAILEEGMKWHQIGIPPEDSQFLETRNFQTKEIARIFRVPPHMIGDVSGSTSWGTGIEQQTMGFITYSLRSWLVRWEQEITRKLLSVEERRTIFAEFLVDGLLRGDIKTRYEAYAVARQNGWMNGNEIRVLENMNPAEGLDDYLVNGNMLPANAAGRPTQESKEEANEG